MNLSSPTPIFTNCSKSSFYRFSALQPNLNQQAADISTALAAKIFNKPIFQVTMAGPPALTCSPVTEQEASKCQATLCKLSHTNPRRRGSALIIQPPALSWRAQTPNNDQRSCNPAGTTGRTDFRPPGQVVYGTVEAF